jgi:hypothetical protein
LLLSSGAPPAKDAPHDGSGVTLVDASPLSLDSSGSAAASGTLETPGGVDMFQCVPTASGLLTVTQTDAAGSALNNLLLIFNDSQQLVDVGGTGTPGAAGPVQIPVIAGNTYFIEAAGYQRSTGAFQLAASIQPQKSTTPGARSIVLDADGSANLGGTIATLGGRDQYQMTATVAGQLTITLGAVGPSSLDPVLLVYNSAGILVASDNDSAAAQTSRVEFSVVTGQTYTVEAGALGLTQGGYTLSIATQDIGDSLAQAQTLALSADGTASVLGQIDAVGEADYYQFAAPFTGNFAVEEDSSLENAIRPAPAILDTSGDALPGVSATTLRGGAAERLVFPVIEGRVYSIRAGAMGNDIGADTVYISPAPAAEVFSTADAINLSSTGYAALSGAIGLPGAAVLYRFVAPLSGLLAISQQAADGTALDSVLSVYDAQARLLESDDDGGGGRDSLIKLTVTAGQTYFVQAAGYGASTGQFALTLATDHFGHGFASATPIALDQTDSGRIAGAIGWSGDADVFQLVLSQPRDLTIALSAANGSTFDGVLSLYNSQGDLIAQSDDDGDDDYDSKASISLAAGLTYYVVASGYSSSIGAYNLFIGNGLGSDRAHAFPISISPSGYGTQAGSIDQPGETTTFEVTAPASGILAAVELSSPDAGLTAAISGISILDASGNVLATQAEEYVGLGPSTLGDNDELPSEMAKAIVPVSAGQSYYIQVGGQGTSTGEYVIDVAFNDAASDAGGPVPTDVTLDPTSHSAGFDGQIALPGDIENFQLTALLTGELVINQTAPPGSFIGSVLVTQPGTSFSASDNAAVGGEDPLDAGKGYSRVAFQVTAGETYSIQVSGVATSVGSFHLDFREFPATNHNLATQDLAQGVTPQQMVAAMLGAGNDTLQIVPGSVQYTGAANASGLFSGGSGILDSREGSGGSFDSGVVLTNGNASNIIGPNDNDAASEINGLPGSPLLDKLVRGGSLDASTLTFQFIPTTNVVELRYVFASEEYDTYVGTPFDDVFGFFINGQDYARVPGTGTALAGTGQLVSVSTINGQVNSEYYIDNTFSPLGGFGHLNTQMNGLTRVLTLEAPVTAGEVNTITLTVADTLDPQVDSAVMVQAGSLRSIREEISPVAGESAFLQLIHTATSLGPLASSGRLTTAQLQLLIQQAVVNGVIKTADLTGNYLVVPVDPIDFTLIGPGGLTVSSSGGQQVAASVPNVFAAGDGANQLLIIPNADPGAYQVSLVGAGPSESLFGASYVSASTGQVTTFLLSGDLQGAATSAVLDFQNPDGQLVVETVGTQAPVDSPGGGPTLVAANLGSSALTAFGALITQLTFVDMSALSLQSSAETTPGTATSLAPIAQPLSGVSGRSTGDSDEQPANLIAAPQALVALWDDIEKKLREIRVQFDAVLGQKWASSLAEVITTLRPDLKTSHMLLEYLFSLPRNRSIRGAHAQSPRGSTHVRSSPAPNSPVSLPTGATPKSSSGPMRTSDGGAQPDKLPPDQRDAIQSSTAKRPEQLSGSAAFPISVAAMGLARLADRQSLRMTGRRASRPAAPDRPSMCVRAKCGPRSGH